MATKPVRQDIDADKFRKMLIDERSRLQDLHHRQRADMDEEASEMADNSVAEHPQAFSSDGPENYDSVPVLNDHERDQALDENAVQVLRQIDRALERIEEGTYGLDEVTGEPIPIERLRALPWATMTVETAERYDK